MQTHPRITNLTRSASNSVENASQDTSVDFSQFNVDKNSGEELSEDDDNEIIQSTENHVLLNTNVSTYIGTRYIIIHFKPNELIIISFLNKYYSTALQQYFYNNN